MIGFKTNTDWTRNKNSESIVYSDANGIITEVTLEDFTDSDTTATQAENKQKFQKIKELSDEFFKDEDAGGRTRARKELPLFDWANEFATESLEAQFFADGDDDAHQAYHARREQMLALVPDVLRKLTEVQRRRFLLHKVEGLTVRQIAEMEGVKHPSVVECLAGVEKKIKRFLAECGWLHKTPYQIGDR